MLAGTTLHDHQTNPRRPVNTTQSQYTPILQPEETGELLSITHRTFRHRYTKINNLTYLPLSIIYLHETPSHPSLRDVVSPPSYIRSAMKKQLLWHWPAPEPIGSHTILRQGSLPGKDMWTPLPFLQLTAEESLLVQILLMITQVNLINHPG